MVRRGEIIEDSMEEEFYLRRLDAGLFVLQLLCYIMVEISNASIPQVIRESSQLLPQISGNLLQPCTSLLLSLSLFWLEQ